MPHASATQASETIFLIMRRMRAPLIVLIVIFAVSVLGPDADPGPGRAGPAVADGLFRRVLLHELHRVDDRIRRVPVPVHVRQRMWVTFAIYLTVIGWAYAIGSLLTLLQDRAFRHALALQQFSAQGAAAAGAIPADRRVRPDRGVARQAFDALGQQFVVIDSRRTASTTLIWWPTTPTCPAWSVTCATRAPAVAGLDHPFCAGVLALTGDDEVNLAVTMAAALLRPDLPVIARTVSPAIAYRMHAFGTPSVVNPFDRVR